MTQHFELVAMQNLAAIPLRVRKLQRMGVISFPQMNTIRKLSLIMTVGEGDGSFFQQIFWGFKKPLINSLLLHETHFQLKYYAYVYFLLKPLIGVNFIQFCAIFKLSYEY